MHNISKRRINKKIKSVVLLRSFIAFSCVAFSAFTLLSTSKVEKTNAQTLPSQQQSSNKSSKYQLLSDTNSPNRQYAIAWGIPGRTRNSSEIEPTDNLDKVENYLVDIKTNKIITTLRNCQYFPSQNHGSYFVHWSANSQLVLFTHQRKWEPQAVSLANVNGVQVNVLDRLVKDARAYLAKNDSVAYQANQKKLVFNLENDSKSLQLTESRLLLPVNVYIPKAENGYERNLLITYQVAKAGNNIILRLIGVKNLV
ncbi:MAG: hypothetical protein KME64_28090 [Scytonematopsis contorta HA4267-MV1]|jgi:hypothetical protein|nr:hypothetical protein [Scytonematopsis contorta HA4267-MV1]